MNHVEVTITQTFHYHGFEMDAAVAKAISALGNTPLGVEISARYVDDDDTDDD
jgi:hypothetical protein